MAFSGGAPGGAASGPRATRWCKPGTAHWHRSDHAARLRKSFTAGSPQAKIKTVNNNHGAQARASSRREHAGATGAGAGGASSNFQSVFGRENLSSATVARIEDTEET